MTSVIRGRAAPVSLRSRWNRAFALLSLMIVLSSVGGFLGTRLLIDVFRDSAVRVEREATIGAQLRADIISHAVVIASAISTAQQRQAQARQAAIRAGYAKAAANEQTAQAKSLLAKSLARWEVTVDAAGPPDRPAALAARGAAVSAGVPIVLGLLDQAGSASRAAARVELTAAARLEREAVAVIAVLELLAILIAVRLARRLSTEVLRPVGALRDSANHLAAGELDHRVVVDRADELGELAVAFNSMADAIAGSHRTLRVEANTDSLTGLANRAAFRARLESILARPNRRASVQAVLFVDLDDFKYVNDSLGHAAGDELLRAVAGRLTTAVRPGALVARLGGDEFALLLDGLSDAAEAVEVAERVVAALAQPVQIGDDLTRVGASVGLALRTADSTADHLLREADVAMYTAKGKGKNRVEQYDAGLDELALARQGLKADVGGAVQRGELVVDYQPVADLGTGTIVGLEALVRWQHPSRGLLPPSMFIELAEESGAIVGIGTWVLATAARQLRHWQQQYGRPDLWISVNVSVCQLDVPTFSADARETLRRSGVAPANLVVEVTESVLADPGGSSAATLGGLRRTGVRVALDDFGTGYSSISYLRELPVDILKIDRSFVAATATDGTDTALLATIVTMARRLSLAIIAEGIEEPDQLIRLRDLGCLVGQGFLLSRPVSAASIDALFAGPTPLLPSRVPALALPQMRPTEDVRQGKPV